MARAKDQAQKIHQPVLGLFLFAPGSGFVCLRAPVTPGYLGERYEDKADSRSYKQLHVRAQGFGEECGHEAAGDRACNCARAQQPVDPLGLTIVVNISRKQPELRHLQDGDDLQIDKPNVREIPDRAPHDRSKVEQSSDYDEVRRREEAYDGEAAAVLEHQSGERPGENRGQDIRKGELRGRKVLEKERRAHGLEDVVEGQRGKDVEKHQRGDVTFA